MPALRNAKRDSSRKNRAMGRRSSLGRGKSACPARNDSLGGWLKEWGKVTLRKKGGKNRGLISRKREKMGHRLISVQRGIEPGEGSRQERGEMPAQPPRQLRREKKDPPSHETNARGWGTRSPSYRPQEREIPLCAGRPPRRSEAGTRKSACSARNDKIGMGARGEMEERR
jgi:hypothetical protein